MPTLLDFRRRIRSVKNTQQITRAMKFVAAARLRRAQEAALAARRPEERILAIVMSGERGLAGAFNTNILRKAHEFFRSVKGKKLSIVPVGKKGRDSLRRAGFNLVGEYVNVLAKVEFSTAREISTLVTDLYAREEIDAVYLIFSEFKTVMSANLVVQKLLPIDPASVEGEESGPRVDYIYEQPEKQLLSKLLPRYAETQVLRAMLESSASEYAARMTAMESATKNAGEVIQGLTLHMNKVRQAAITKEIIEIVSGASYGAQ